MKKNQARLLAAGPDRRRSVSADRLLLTSGQCQASAPSATAERRRKR